METELPICNIPIPDNIPIVSGIDEDDKIYHSIKPCIYDLKDGIFKIYNIITKYITEKPRCIAITINDEIILNGYENRPFSFNHLIELNTRYDYLKNTKNIEHIINTICNNCKLSVINLYKSYSHVYRIQITFNPFDQTFRSEFFMSEGFQRRYYPIEKVEEGIENVSDAKNIENIKMNINAWNDIYDKKHEVYMDALIKRIGYIESTLKRMEYEMDRTKGDLDRHIINHNDDKRIRDLPSCDIPMKPINYYVQFPTNDPHVYNLDNPCEYSNLIQDIYTCLKENEPSNYCMAIQINNELLFNEYSMHIFDKNKITRFVDITTDNMRRNYIMNEENIKHLLNSICTVTCEKTVMNIYKSHEYPYRIQITYEPFKPTFNNNCTMEFFMSKEYQEEHNL